MPGLNRALNPQAIFNNITVAFYAAATKNYIYCSSDRRLSKYAILKFSGVPYAVRNESPYSLAATILSLYTAGEKTFVYADGKEYTLDDGGEYAFTSGEIDFSTDGKKVLKEVVIDSPR